MHRRVIFQWGYNLLKSKKKFMKFPKQSLCIYQMTDAQIPIPLHCNIKYKSSERWLCVEKSSESSELLIDQTTYEKMCSITLDALNDYMEQLLENAEGLSGTDITYSDGVLNIKLGPDYGTYVINRQTPNRQIWLSSPFSGPKRYDFVGPITGETGKWVYRHTGQTMHHLLQEELQPIFKNLKLEFGDLPYAR